jgi:hypothetical protein
MSQIEITVLKQGTKHPNVISCSFFTMEDAYRPFGKYQVQLKRFLDRQVKQVSDFEIRIYTDDTGSEFALKVATDPNVSVYHYNCPEFREGRGHVGTFGTLVRFLPLFEKHNIAWVADIDIPDFFVGQQNLDDINQHKTDFKISCPVCYERKVYGRKYTMVAGRFISKIQIPKRLLTSFIKHLVDGKYQKEIDLLNAANTRKPPSAFPYGVDELFLNWTVYDWMKRANYKVFVESDMMVTSMLTKNIELPKKDEQLLDEYYRTSDKKLLTKMKILYKKWIPQVLNKYPCLQQFLDVLNDPKEFKNDFYVRTVIKSSEL